jgi:phospholipid/cholesterol/gamma-HCH transport system substrate-binding protein
VAALAGSVAWVKHVDVGRRDRTVSARFRDVGNARVGNAVVIRGVVGGHVKAIELAPSGWVIVRMKLDPLVALPADPVVLLNESSLFGEWQAMIAERSALPPDVEVRRQVTEASGVRDMIPGASLPGIGKLTAVAGQIAGDVATVAGRVEVAFDDRAARELRGSFRNVSELSTTLATTVREHANDLDTLSSQLRIAVHTMNRTADTVQGIAQRVDSTVPAEQLKSLVADVSAGAAELRRTTANVRELSERFARSQGRLESFLANGDSVLAKINAGKGSLGLMVNDPSMYRQGDSLMTQLRELVADVKQNPKKYISIKLF